MKAKTNGFIQIFVILGMAVLASALTVFTIENHVPLSYIGFEEDLQFGTTLTTINGTDTISSSRTVINNNFTALNSGKMEVSTTSVKSITTLENLVSIGTITTGIWNGTTISGAYGGTGTTSPTQYMTMLGNGSNGLTHASTTGTTGQVFTSNGAGAYPSWQTYAIDEGGDYSWTGTNSFATTTTIQSTSGGLSPAGSIIAYSTTTAPSGWLLCNGASLATSSYPQLFAVIGYSYGGSSANFNLPDLRGNTIVMASTTETYFDAMGEKGGATSTTLAIANMPAHDHPGSYVAGSGGASTGVTSVTTGNTTVSTNVLSQGSGTAFSNLSPYIVLNYIIKY